MNWGGSGRRLDSDNDHSIFVGDLAPDVTDDILFTTFSSRFSSVRGAKVSIYRL
jgi:RNA recognition motif-containing protein